MGKRIVVREVADYDIKHFENVVVEDSGEKIEISNFRMLGDSTDRDAIILTREEARKVSQVLAKLIMGKPDDEI